MAFTAAVKADIIQAYKQSEKDTGSSDVQIALLSKRINYLTEHLKTNKNDVHTRHGLMKLVSQRRKLMTYLKRTHLDRYKNLIEKLGIRG